MEIEITPEKIIAYRESRGLDRPALGNLCHVSASTVANWELGRNKPHGAAKEKLQSLLSGEVAVIPLTAQEERLLDEIVDRGGFASREDFLTQTLVDVIKQPSRSAASDPVARSKRKQA